MPDEEQERGAQVSHDIDLIDRVAKERNLKAEAFRAAFNRELLALGADEELSRSTFRRVRVGEREMLLREAIAMSRVLDIPLRELVRKPVHKRSGTTFRTTVEFHQFESREKLATYLLKLEEKEGRRIAVLSRFPSSIHTTTESSGTDWKRARLFLDSATANAEFYPIVAFLTFCYSPVRRLESREKIEVLKRMVEHFSGLHHELCFFWDTESVSTSGIDVEFKSFQDLEILGGKEKTALLSSPIQKTVFEISDEEAVQRLFIHHHNTANFRGRSVSGSQAIQALQIAIDTLEVCGSDDRAALKNFVECWEAEGLSGGKVLRRLIDPEIFENENE